MYNMTDYVHPFHWNVEDFEALPGLSPEQEFDAIAPVAIYFAADVCYKEKARGAWNKLKAANHPVVADMTAQEMLQERSAPEGINERYNALFMYLCCQTWTSAVFDQDRWGALTVAESGDRDAKQLAGACHGQFPWYATSSMLKTRLQITMGASCTLSS